jgi:ribose transport system permease protein
MNQAAIRRFFTRTSYLFPLALLIVVIMINYSRQDNLLQPSVLNRNIRVFLPLMILAAGQAIVIIGGGIDLSVGAMVSMCNAVLVTWITPESAGGEIMLAILLTCLIGMAAGAVNGIAVAYLRLQPIVTTYATSFIFAGIALYVLPRPGGQLPRDMTTLYRQLIEIPVFADIPIVRDIPILNEIPPAFVVILGIILLWAFVRQTRFVQYIYAAGDNPEAAYTTGIPVQLIRFGTYVVAGLFAALAALALTMSLGSGSSTSGDAMTLDSIVAVVLGGTRLRGGQGGIIGAMIGVVILGIIRNIISFYDVPTWSQTLVDALIILIALAAPGLIRFFTRIIREYRIRRGHIT